MILGMMSLVRPLLVVGLVAATFSHAAAAQTFEPQPSDDYRSPVAGEVTTLGLNVLLGGLVGGIGQYHQDGRFRVGFSRGMAGGAVMYAGKRVSVERWSGAGLVGREISAVGVSMVGNAAQGLPLLSRVTLPAGPLRFTFGERCQDESRVKLDVAGTIAIGYALSRGMRFDAGESLSSGAPVFHKAGGNASGGTHVAGVTMYEMSRGAWGLEGPAFETMTSHERVHVLQHDFGLQVLGGPLQRRVLRGFPGASTINRYFDVGFHYPVWAGLNAVVPYADQPWEKEAYFLSNRPTDAGALTPR